MKKNDLHLHKDRYLVMVQWGSPPYEDSVLLTVSSMNPEGRLTPDDGGFLRGETVTLDADQRARVIAALRGEAPLCDCEHCQIDARLDVGAMIAGAKK